MGAEVSLLSLLGKTMINAGDLMRLRVGDIIPLDTEEEEEIDILVEGIPKFKGRPGAIKGQTALEVTSLVDNPNFDG